MSSHFSFCCSQPRSGAANVGRAGKSNAKNTAAVSSSAATDRATVTTRKRPVGLETAAKPEASGESDTVSGEQTESALVTSEATQPNTTAPKATERKAKGGKKVATNAAKPPRQPPQISTASRASKRMASENQPVNDAGASCKNDVSCHTSKAKLEPPKQSAGRGGKEVKTGEGEKVGRVTRSTTANAATASGRGGAAVREVGVKKPGKAGKKRVNTAELSGLATTGKKRVKCDSTPVNTKLSFSDSSSAFSSTSPPLPPSMNTTTNTIDPVPDCAWVALRHVSIRPNSHLTSSALHNIDDVLGPCAFSPFKFTARQATPGQLKKRRETPGKKFAFGFQMTTDQNPFSQPAETTGNDRAAQSSDVTLDTMSVDSLDCNDAPNGGESKKVVESVVCASEAANTETAGEETTHGTAGERDDVGGERIGEESLEECRAVVGVGGGQRSLGVEAWCGGVVSSVYGKVEDEEGVGVQNGDPTTSEATGKPFCRVLSVFLIIPVAY